MENMTVWTGGGVSQVCGKTEHPEYNRHNLHRDIAVIQLCTQIIVTEGKLTKTVTSSFRLRLSAQIKLLGVESFV